LVIDNNDANYNSLLGFLNNLVNNGNIQYAEELEIASQTGEVNLTKRVIYRIRNIEKANKLFKETGIKGEELLYQYFDFKKEILL
jgi:hypothetical protein